QAPKLIRNEFGGSIGGPVVLPKIYNGKNRTFFFFSREGVELRQGLTKDFAVPTAAMRRGDFSDLFDSTGRFIQLYDPLTTRVVQQPNGRMIAVRDPFVNNQIPLNRMSPLAKAIWGITPLPTDITSPVITTNFKVAVPTNGNPSFSDNPTTIRIDHRFSEKDNFFLKTNGGRRIAYFQGTGGGTGAPTIHHEANATYLPMQAISGVLNWTHVFSSTFFVESLAAQTWQSTKTVTGPVDEQQNWARILGLPNPYGEIGFPNITSLGNLETYTEGDNRRALTSQILSLQQNYNLIRGTHNIQFGWSLYTEKQHLLPDQGAISGSVAFNSQSTALESSTLGSDTAPQAVPQTGYDAANFFLGYAGSYNIGLKRSYLRLHNRNMGMYLQDSYKVNSRLTLTPGVRWDINPAMSEDDYQLNGYDVKSHTVLLPQPLDYYYKLGSTTPQVVSAFQNAGVSFSTADQLGKPKNIFPSNLFDIGPRFGFAYTAFSGARQLVIRGGYGMYISAIPMRTLLAQFSSMAPFRAGFSYNPNSAAQSPNGIQNYLLTHAPEFIAGSNTTNVIDLNNPSALGRGQSVVGIDPRFPSLRIHEWNLTLEKQVSGSMVFRVRYNGKHGVNADQLNEINPAPTNYLFYSTTGRQLPNAPGNRVFDSTNYGSIRLLAKTGFINAETFVLEVERRFSKGLGFQAFYTLTNSLRAGGNSFRDGIGTIPEQFLPGTVPTEPGALNRFLNYDRDTGLPKHRIRWNFNYDVPFGKGRRFAGGANKSLNAAIGGWKLAGTGTVVSSWWAVPTNNWGPIGEVHVYGTKYPILDCRSTSATATNTKNERCYQGYLYYNGYVSQRQINSRNAAGLRNGVYGLPADYKPFQAPINPWPVGGLATDPGNAQYDTNNVNIRLQNGSTVQTGYDTGLHPMRNQFRLGPFNWTQDASVFKFFEITERQRLRANLDVFNVFNVQGLNTPGSDGIVTLQNSYGGFGFRPRQVQITMRLEW
ncbi:MAG: TonB-dependent receptor, partial [Acidobacteriota bacterium]|nr:TonB-dependent receptor [Acidobacteriota bacterium]